jgi:tRNA (guanine-N1)-methyltransferase
MKVPEVLLNGNHDKIKKWRDKQSLDLTLKRKKII